MNAFKQHILSTKSARIPNTVPTFKLHRLYAGSISTGWKQKRETEKENDRNVREKRKTEH